MVSDSRQSFGKRQEFAAIAEMLKQGLDVYTTLVDDKGIDCVIRKDEKTYYDVQIKARGKGVKYPGNFNLDIPDPRPNYIFVLYAEEVNKVWVIPCERITGSDGRSPLGGQIKSGANEGRWYIDPVWRTKTGLGFDEKFEQYENAWHYLGSKKDF